jgi:hypothetical protein
MRDVLYTQSLKSGKITIIDEKVCLNARGTACQYMIDYRLITPF